MDSSTTALSARLISSVVHKYLWGSCIVSFGWTNHWQGNDVEAAEQSPGLPRGTASDQTGGGG